MDDDDNFSLTFVIMVVVVVIFTLAVYVSATSCGNRGGTWHMIYGASGICVGSDGRILP